MVNQESVVHQANQVTRVKMERMENKENQALMASQVKLIIFLFYK